MKKTLLFIFFAISSSAFCQEVPYNETLAKSLGADDYGMKQYVFCLLKTGTFTSATPEERKTLFEGHMVNINRLAKENKLALAGPFMKNDREYRGIYIFNVTTIEEAKTLVATDPAINANLLEAELTLWYGSAALLETLKIHEKISKKKF